MKFQTRNVDQSVPFKSIELGDLFDFDCEIYMKITEVTECDVTFNAVNLYTGAVAEFNPQEKVFKASAISTTIEVLK